MSLPLLMWGSGFFLLVIMAICLVIKKKNYLTAIIIYGFCISFPIVWVSRDCIIRSSSEACVWGQAFMPFYLGVALVMGSVIYLIWMLCRTLIIKSRDS